MMEKKSPWSNVPKMSRKQAADWKKDPMNRKNWRPKKNAIVSVQRIGADQLADFFKNFP